MASIEEVLARLAEHGITPHTQRGLANGQTQIWPEGMDACINVWETGTCNVQGAEKAQLEEILGDLVGKGGRRARRQAGVGHGRTGVPAGGAPPAEVFVVYGHDVDARTQLEAMLRRWHCEPLILDQLPSEGTTVIEKLAKYQSDIGFGVVLTTPDDPSPTGGLFRARQNVVLELGMLLTKLGRDRVAILLKNPSVMERPSDIDGLIYLSFTQNVEEIKVSLAREMEAKGYNIPVGRL